MLDELADEARTRCHGVANIERPKRFRHAGKGLNRNLAHRATTGSIARRRLYHQSMLRPAPIGLAVALMASVAHADALSGRASVIDGDTIEIHGERVRILDVDAPESGQLCFKKSESIDKGAWPCGRQATLALSEWIGEQIVSCDATRKDKRRWLARCAVAGQDVGEWLAASGWVVPYRDCKCEVVRQAADRAKAAQLGIWSSNFTMPWEWRKAH